MSDMYRDLAPFYDLLNESVPVSKWADSYENRYKKYGRMPIREVLDLGCGTGSMTLELARRGYDMVGLDRSAEMLSEARERALKEGREDVLWLCQDMTDFDLFGTVDAVVSTLDCVNHLPDTEALRRCFSLVHLFLVPDGLFLFDVNTPYKFSSVYAASDFILEKKNVLCAWRNEYHPRKKTCDFCISLFTPNPDGTYERSDSVQTERCFSEKEIRDALRETGFVMEAWDGDLDGNCPDDTCERWHITARARK